MATRDNSGFDLAAALAGIEAPRATVEVSAGFFHRTLARWLGLPEGRAGRAVKAPLWDYDFWKAELVDEGTREQRRTFTARIFRSAGGEAESYRYWLTLDAGGRIKSSGWLSEAPDLVGDAEKRVFVAPGAPSAAALEGLFIDAD